MIDGVEYVPAREAPKDKSLVNALEARFDSDAGVNLTIRDYLCELLMRLWEKGEGFSGKRPFGNSGWEYDIYRPLIRGGFIPGKLDSEGYVDTVDKIIAEPYVFKLIQTAFYGSKSSIENDS